MSEFRTEINPEKFPFEITHQDKIVSIGSCFSENIGNKMKDLKFDISVNPYGILFNPFSIFNALEEIISQKKYTEKDLANNNKKWFSFNHHSSFSGLEKVEVLNKINSSNTNTYNQIKEAKIVFITFGTSWVYTKKDTQKTVANCYKLPSNLFDKKLLTVDEIIKNYSQLISKITELNPSIKFVNTISPVRHWKDGFIENQQSKSTLILALKSITEQHNNCFYFPSYEIVMDDLRDYRFYENDMLHPTPTAVNYIWQKLEACILTPETLKLNKRIEQINNSLNHKPFNPNSEESSIFKEKLNFKIEELKRNILI